MQDKHKVIKNMLYYRTLLCFAQGEGTATVTGISKQLNAEKYQISRVVSSLEEEGIVEKDSKGVPSLTKYGDEYIQKYQNRVDTLLSFFRMAKLDPAYARDLALHISANANDEIMRVIEIQVNRYKSKAKLADKQRFSGNHFVQKIEIGSYSLPCTVLCRLDNGLMTYISQDKPQRIKINVDNRGGTLQFFPENNRVKGIKFFNNGEYIQAEKLTDMYFIPIESMGFSQMSRTEYGGLAFVGVVNIKITMEEARGDMEREGIIEIFF
mgnify:FL=1